jgi:hypothetical protein
MSDADNAQSSKKPSTTRFPGVSAMRPGPDPAGLSAPAERGPLAAAPATGPEFSATTASPGQAAGTAGTPISEYEREVMGSIPVPFSTRISFQANQQLASMMEPGKAGARRGKKRTKTDLLAEALNLLFKKYGLPQVVDE